MFNSQCKLNRGVFKEIPYQLNGQAGILRINLCSYFKVPEQCKNKTVDYTSVLFISDSGDCIELISYEKSKNQYNLLDEKTPNNGLVITENVDNFKVVLQCVKDQKEPAYIIDTNKNLQITSNDACGYKNELAEFIHNNKYLYCTILIVLGLVLLLLGGSKWDLILTVTGFLGGFGGIWFIFWAFVKFNKNNNSYIIISIIAFIVGILVAALCRTFTELSYFVLGFLAGFMTSKYILITLQFKGEEWLYNLIIIGAGLIVGALCLLVQKYCLALVTSILGGLLVTFNFGFMIGVLDNLYDIFDKIKNGQDVKPVYYVFFVLFIIVSLSGFFYQCKSIKGENYREKISQNQMLLN